MSFYIIPVLNLYIQMVLPYTEDMLTFSFIRLFIPDAMAISAFVSPNCWVGGERRNYAFCE